MDADRRGCSFEELTEIVIGCAFRVANELGVGFLERVYENALAHELRKAGVEVKQQIPIQVRYDGVIVGDYIVDLLVEDQLIIELKHSKALTDADLAQALNYLKATGKELALLINFGTSRVQVKRAIRSTAPNQ
jgi:GxxExxY protein